MYSSNSSPRTSNSSSPFHHSSLRRLLRLSLPVCDAFDRGPITALAAGAWENYVEEVILERWISREGMKSLKLKGKRCKKYSHQEEKMEGRGTI